MCTYAAPKVVLSYVVRRKSGRTAEAFDNANENLKCFLTSAMLLVLAVGPPV